MKPKSWLIIFGILLSTFLLVIILARLNWQTFLTTLQTIQISGLLLTASILGFNIVLRSLRWNLVADLPLAHFKHFWQAASIGYLGNMIYPARAGEVLKMVAIHRFTALVPGRAIVTVVIDRMLDLITAGLFMLLVLWLHQNKIDPALGHSLIFLFISATLGLILVTLFANHLYVKAQNWPISGRWWSPLKKIYLHTLESVLNFRKTHNLLIIIPLSLFIFLFDYYAIWQLMLAFDWKLPYQAAITVGVFIMIGISLPSAPAYVGIYQVACVLALALYQIGETPAVTYSIVLQLVTFGWIGVQGVLVAFYCGFQLSRDNLP